MAAALRTIAQLWAAIGTANDTANFALNSPVAQSERLVCDIWASNPSALSLNPDAVADDFNARCGEYYDELGTDPPEGSPPGFTGGQCETMYDVSIQATEFDGAPNCNGSQANTTIRVQGPISDVFVRNEDLPNDPNDFRTFIIVSAAGGERVALSSFTDIGCSGYVIDSVSVSRVDGQPDNCGDPPSGPIAPTPNYPRPPTFNPDGSVTANPSTGDLTINIDARTDIDGDEYYEITGPGFEYIRSPGFTEPRIPESQPDATDGAPSQPTGDGGEVTDDLTQEEEEEGLETIGYAWSLSSYPSNAGIVQDTNPDVFFTPLGNVQLVYDVNGSNRFSDNLPIRAASGTIIRNDASLKVRAVRFNKRPDVGGITLTPIRRVKADAS